MKVTVQVVVHADDDTQTVVREAFTLTREALAPDTLGLQLQEAKDLLAAVQDTLVEHQVTTALSSVVACPDCGIPRPHKDSRLIVMRTLFGTLRLDSPRWWACPCAPGSARTFSPLAAVLRERTTPELSYLQARFAGLVSYGLSADLLNEILPLGRALHATTVRRQMQATAQRLEDELGDEQPGFITSPADWSELPRPDLPLVVGLDGGYVHSCTQRTRRDGWFEVIAGKAMPADGRSCCFGYVQTYDSKPKRRLFEVLASQGMQANQQVTFLTDGGEDIRELPRYLDPQAEHLLDWFHLTMRITVMMQLAKGLRVPPEVSGHPRRRAATAEMVSVARQRLPLVAHRRRHRHRPHRHRHRRRVGQAHQGGPRVRRLPRRQRLSQPPNPEGFPGPAPIRLRRRSRLHGDRRHADAVRSPASPTTGSAGAPGRPSPPRSSNPRSTRSSANAWSKAADAVEPRGAHLLLQIRTRVLNDTLADDYRRWYPGFAHSDWQDQAE